MADNHKYITSTMADKHIHHQRGAVRSGRGGRVLRSTVGAEVGARAAGAGAGAVGQ